MKKDGLEKNKFLRLISNKVIFAFVLFSLVISQTGVGFVFAYNKIAQGTGTPSADDDIVPTEDFEVRKFFQNPLPAGSRIRNGVLYTQKGQPLNMQIWFKGKTDKNPNVAVVDVMLLIDRSMSMKSKVNIRNDEEGESEECLFNGYDPHSDPNTPFGNYIAKDTNDPNYVPGMPVVSDFDNTKLCWSAQAAMKYVQLTGGGGDIGQSNLDFKLGYVTYGWDGATKKEEDAQYYKPLTDMKDATNRTITKQWLNRIGFHTGPSGTSMAEATDIALEELRNNGRQNAKKYIILLTDGVGNQQSTYNRATPSALTGCMSFRRTRADAWPSNWPNSLDKCSIPPGSPGGPPGERPIVPGAPPTGYPTFDTNPPDPNGTYPAEWGNCCITRDLNQKEGFYDETGVPGSNRYIDVADFNQSPIGIAGRRNIKIPTIGFGSGGSGAGKNINLNVPLLFEITDYTYKDQNAHIEYSFMNNSPGDLYEAFRAIFYEQVGDRGAEINFTETLPPGTSISSISIFRNVNDSAYCQANFGTDSCRRPFNVLSGGGQSQGNTIKININNNVLTFRIDPSNYWRGIPFNNQRFFINLTLDTTNIADGPCDIDQNKDCECKGEPCSAAEPVSKVVWDYFWTHAGGDLITTPTPKLCVNFRTAPYTGDVYGQTSINPYSFPFIDVLVSGGDITPGTLAVWELKNYTFAPGTMSNFDSYKQYLTNQIDGMIARAEVSGSLGDALSQDIRTAIYPDGKIFYVEGSQTIGAPGVDNPSILIGKGRRTVIINGDLNLYQGISKQKNSPAAIIVLGNIRIYPEAKIVEAGLIAPEVRGRGIITIVDSAEPLDIEGYVIGAEVNLKGRVNAVTAQSIIYDIEQTKFPPPGIAGLNLPLYHEVAP